MGSFGVPFFVCMDESVTVISMCCKDSREFVGSEFDADDRCTIVALVVASVAMVPLYITAVWSSCMEVYATGMTLLFPFPWLWRLVCS